MSMSRLLIQATALLGGEAFHPYMVQDSAMVLGQIEWLRPPFELHLPGEELFYSPV
jgi:hypothetical protein